MILSLGASPHSPRAYEGGVEVGSDSESGSGTLLAVGLIALALACALLLAASCLLLGERARLDAVAQLSALAGAEDSATALWEEVGDRPCSSVDEVARANEVLVDSCEVLGADTRVIVSVRRSLFGMSAPIRGRARAGPMEDVGSRSRSP